MVAAISFSAALGAAPAKAVAEDLYARIHILLKNGQANDALAALQTMLATNSQDAQAHNLLCRVHYEQQQWADATRECETAVKLSPNNSEFHDWLGRAYGEQAQRASMLSAYGLAKKVHAEFEQAAALDPHNVQALVDLGEFSVDAPGFLGGGIDKAQAIAGKLQPLDAGKSHILLAAIASKNKDTSTAERELKLAVAQSKSPAKAWMALASFYGKQNNLSAMVQAVQSGVSADKSHGSALVEGAGTLMRYKQNPGQAESMLRQYLASTDKSEDAPAFQVHVQLGNLLAEQGNKQAAQQEYAAAQAMASGYAIGHHAK